MATCRHITTITTTTSYTNNNEQMKPSSSSLYAGFGGGGASSSKEKKKSKSTEIKLKPKQQWDRYVELKDELDTAVAVRIEGTDAWLGVGSVKSQDTKYTPQAVFRQRALIVEHAKRLHPGQLASSSTKNNKQQLQWGYYAEPEGQWVIADKSCMENIDAEGIPKLVGFKGRPDPATGFYTEIAGGRMDASALGQKSSAGSGGPVTGSNKKGTGDGVI